VLAAVEQRRSNWQGWHVRAEAQRHSNWQGWHVRAEAQRHIRRAADIPTAMRDQLVDRVVAEVLNTRSISLARQKDGVTEPAALCRILAADRPCRSTRRVTPS
jgi:hypothetical protein